MLNFTHDPAAQSWVADDYFTRKIFTVRCCRHRKIVHLRVRDRKPTPLERFNLFTHIHMFNETR